MKIAYLGQMADVSCENGISKKIRSQAAAWRAQGHEVRYFALAPTDTVWRELRPFQPEVLVRGWAGQRVLQSQRLARRIRAWGPEVIYFRYAHHSAGLPPLFRAIPTVAEINSDDLTEYPLTLSASKVLYHRITRRRVLTAVTGFVAVTRELAGRFAGFGKPTEVIGNGFDFDEQPAANPALARTERPRLIFVGSAGSPWHGLDRVAELAGLLPGADFDVVGCDRPAGASPPNLHFHGRLTRDRYEPLLRNATAAIGTMALFKKRMDEACPLKVREYLASGLPVVAAYEDTDIAADAEFFLRLPNDARPLDGQRAQIETWLAGWRDRRVSRAAVAHLDTKVKEAKRLAFLARFAGQKPATP